MNTQLIKDVVQLLNAYHQDIIYLHKTRDYEGVNYTTSGTPCFESEEEVEAYQTRVENILKEVKELQNIGE